MSYQLKVLVIISLTLIQFARSEIKYVNIKNLTEFEYNFSVESLDDDLHKDHNQLKEADRKYKLSGCTFLFRNLLEVKNNSIDHTLKKTKFSKEVTFDKIYAESLHYCINNITDDVIDKILNESEIFSIDKSLYEKYLKFEASRFQIMGPIPYLTVEEKAVIEELENSSENPGFSVDLIENDLNTHFSILKGRGLYIAIGLKIGLVLCFIVKIITK